MNKDYTIVEEENKILDNLRKSGIIQWNGDKENCGTWSGYDIPGTCLRMYNRYGWFPYENKSKEYWNIATIRFTVVVKTIYTLKDFPSSEELINLHNEGLKQNEWFSTTPDF